jgi:hypothetical protein
MRLVELMVMVTPKKRALKCKRLKTRARVRARLLRLRKG